MELELVGLHQAALQFVAIGDVVENDQPADLLHVLGDQGRDGEVQDVRHEIVAAPLPFPLAAWEPFAPARRTNL